MQKLNRKFILFIIFLFFILSDINILTKKAQIKTIKEKNISKDKDKAKAIDPIEDIIKSTENFYLNKNNDKNKSNNVTKNYIKDNKEENIIWRKTPIIKAFSFIDNKGVIYNLSPLYDDKFDYYVNNKEDNSFYFFNIGNFGNNICKKNKSYIIYKKNEDCVLLSGTNKDKPSEFQITSGELSQNKDNSNNEIKYENNIVVINLPKGEKCLSDPNKYYRTTYIITCDHDVSKVIIDNSNDLNVQKCENVIKMRSKHACPNNKINGLSIALERNSKFFGIFLIFFGIFFTFFSYKYSDFTQFLIGILTFIFFSIFLVLRFLQTEIFYNQLHLMIWFFVSVLLGIILGFFYKHYLNLCVYTLGLLNAYISTLMLTQSLIILLSQFHDIFFWVIFVSFSCLLIYIGHKFRKHFFIIYCCFIGGYGIIRV
jgi:hypothetical protein